MDDSTPTELQTWRMLGTALADDLCAHNNLHHPNTITTIKAIISFARRHMLTSTTPITEAPPHCTAPPRKRPFRHVPAGAPTGELGAAIYESLTPSTYDDAKKAPHD